MIQTRLFSKTLRSFTESSKSLTKSVHDNCRRLRRSSLGFSCLHRLRRRGEILREENKPVGGSTNSKTTLGELMKLREGDEDKKEREDQEETRSRYDKERGIIMKLRQKEPAGPGTDVAVLMEEVKERERRVKESYEALARLIEVEVMEASDVEQALDLKEVFSDYPLIKNHLLVDLMNTFILDVSNSILPART